MNVLVAPPDVEGEAVRFRWTQSAPNPFQRVDAFFLRYEGLDLSAFSPLLFYEIFLALQLKVFAAYDEPVEVVFPEPLPRLSVEFWQALHDADQVTIGPVHEKAAYEPWRATLTVSAASRPFGVFFGGGKDSTLATCLLAEVYDRENVLLIQFVGPLNPSRDLERRLTLRQEALMLRPARERLGVTTQRVWTDYQARFCQEGYHARPHLELYTAGALPVLLAWNTLLVTFCLGWPEYPIYRLPDGQVQFRFPRSRPEVLAAQSRHYQCALGTDLTITNLNLPFNALTTVRLLAERYPAALAGIVPCTHGGVDERWCYQCGKCANTAMLALACGYVDPGIDHDRLFTESRYVQRLVAHAESGVERSMDGNAPWTPLFTSPYGYTIFCQALSHLSPAAVADQLGPVAMANLLAIRSLFGNRDFPAVDLLPARTFALLNNEAARDVARIATEHIPAVADPPGPQLAGNDPIEYDFGVVMPTRLDHLSHRWQEGESEVASLVALEERR